MKFFPRTNDLFDTVLDDMFTSPIFSTRNDMAMKTDITEKDGKYLLDMELPGCKKEGNLIRQERYSGSFSRSFYVGENVSEEDIKASYENGELKISFPKEVEKLPEKKTIMIE